MTLDLSETFVLDAVSHAYNLDAGNVLDERYAGGIGVQVVRVRNRVENERLREVERHR